MSTEAMVKAIKVSSFAISVIVLEGNIMLLYLSQDLKYAAIGSIFSIFTEVNAHPPANATLPPLLTHTLVADCREGVRREVNPGADQQAPQEGHPEGQHGDGGGHGRRPPHGRK
jgi:hypothetical protein